MTNIMELVRMRFATLVASALLISMFGCSQTPAPNGDRQPAGPDTGEPAREGSMSTVTGQPAPPDVSIGTPQDSHATGEVSSSSAPDELAIGSVAPALAIGNWLQGDPVEHFKPGHIYVVEFWATRCPPCLTSMPHLASMQEKYADQVTFVGISNESESIVLAFLDKVQNEETGATWREVASYTLALDASWATSEAYMTASGQDGIPTAFVVGPDRHIEWIGHPMELDDPIEQIVAGTWDRQQYLARIEEEKRLQEAMAQAMAGLRGAFEEGEWDEAIRLADLLVKDYPDYFDPMLKFSILLKAERYQEVVAMAEEMARDHWEQSDRLNAIAWTFASLDPVPELDYSAVLRIAKRASELRDDKDPSALDTIARIYFVQGDIDSAITWQEKAVNLAGNPKGLEERLATYQQQRERQSDSELPPEDGGDGEPSGESSKVPAEPDATQPPVAEDEE